MAESYQPFDDGEPCCILGAYSLTNVIIFEATFMVAETVQHAGWGHLERHALPDTWTLYVDKEYDLNVVHDYIFELGKCAEFALCPLYTVEEFIASALSLGDCWE